MEQSSQQNLYAEETVQKIDKTIESICDATQEMIEREVRSGEISKAHTDMVSALAELIKANAEYKLANFQAKATLENYSTVGDVAKNGIAYVL